MTHSTRLSEYIRACFTDLWIESHEHDDALAEIGRLCRDEVWWLAAVFGKIKDQFGGQMEAPITEFPNFEHLEAKGQEAAHG